MEHFRQVVERHISGDVTFMTWNPQHDLIALLVRGNGTQEVVIHRLSWDITWAYKPAEAVDITSMAWRPDGKVLCVGYTSGMLELLDVENAEKLYTRMLPKPVSSMAWVPVDSCTDSMTLYSDLWKSWLPALPPLEKGSARKTSKTWQLDSHFEEDRTRIRSQKKLNVLLVTCRQESVYLLVYGVYCLGCIDVPALSGMDALKVLCAEVSSDLSTFCFGVSSESHLGVLTANNGLRGRVEEVHVVSQKCGTIESLLGYCRETSEKMAESWEDILVEMNRKLMHLANQKQLASSRQSVSDDFLQLLLFGTPSDELQNFLLEDLKAHELKKFAASVESMYLELYKLIHGHLLGVLVALFSHVDDLSSMARWKEQFAFVHLSEHELAECLQTVSATALKALEVQEAIEANLRELRCFFTWLQREMLILCDEKLPATLSKSAREVESVVSFLEENLRGDAAPHGFSLDRVGQYLLDEDLRRPSEASSSLWAKLHDLLPPGSEGVVVPRFPDKSLRQLLRQMESSVERVLRPQAVHLNAHLSDARFLPVAPVSESRGSFCFRSVQRTLYALCVCSSQQAVLVRVRDGEAQQVTLELGRMEGIPLHGAQHRLVDASFYDDGWLTLLACDPAAETESSALVQVPLAAIDDGLYQPLGSSHAVDVARFADELLFRRMEHFHCTLLAVSGHRRVSALYSAQLQSVRVFEMDAAEDESDDSDETASPPSQ